MILRFRVLLSLFYACRYERRGIRYAARVRAMFEETQARCYIYASVAAAVRVDALLMLLLMLPMFAAAVIDGADTLQHACFATRCCFDAICFLRYARRCAVDMSHATYACHCLHAIDHGHFAATPATLFRGHACCQRQLFDTAASARSDAIFFDAAIFSLPEALLCCFSAPPPYDIAPCYFFSLPPPYAALLTRYAADDTPCHDAAAVSHAAAFHDASVIAYAIARLSPLPPY